MSEPSLSLRRLFSLPGAGPQEPKSEGWRKFSVKISEEVKGINWPAAMPDLMQKTLELFDVEIPELLNIAWNKGTSLQKVLGESRNSPDETQYLELIEHTIESEHHPYIEIQVKNVPIKKIEITVVLLIILKGFILKIREGRIREIQTGSCEIEGRAECLGETIAEKKLELFKLPGSITIADGATV